MAQTNDPNPGPASSLGDVHQFLNSLLDHEDTLSELANYPCAIFHQRFLRLRRARSWWIERQAHAAERELNELVEKKRFGALDNNPEEVCRQVKDCMDHIELVLAKSSQVYEQDSFIVQAPAVLPYFMQFFRTLLQRKATRLPNGQDVKEYGSTGDDVSPELAALRDVDNHLIRDFVLIRILIPIRPRLVQWRAFVREKLGLSQSADSGGIRNGPLVAIADAVECAVGVLTLSVPVLVVYNISSTRNRLIAMIFLGLPFLYAVMFLSAGAKRSFGLIATYFAVMVVFVSATGCHS